MTKKQGRNEVCPCGSGKKYKKCCGMQKALQKQMKFEILRGGSAASEFFTKGLKNRLFKVMDNAQHGIGHKISSLKKKDDFPEEASTPSENS